MLPLSILIKVMKLEQALGVSSKGACFGVTDPSRLRPPFRSLQKPPPAEELKEIFVVDKNLRITPAKIPASVWEHEEKIFAAKIGSMPVIVIRGQMSKFRTYAGFETEKEARAFKKTAQLAEKARRKRKQG